MAGLKRGLKFLWRAALLLVVAGCEPVSEHAAEPEYGAAPDLAVPIYRVAVHPLHNPRKLTAAYSPLIGYLNRHFTEVQFELEASRDYQTYEAKLRNREPELVLPNPWQTLEAIKHGYRVIAMAGDAEDFKGLYIVRKDSGITVPADLKGKAVSYPSPTALAACIMPQWFLHQHGIDVNHDILNHYVGSQESSIMHVYLGEVVAGATWPPPWRLFQKEHPKEAAELKVIWETPPLLNNAFMVRDDLPAEFVERLRQLLLMLHDTAEGRGILANMQTARFHAADDASYAPVREFIDRFEREVRYVEQP